MIALPSIATLRSNTVVFRKTRIDYSVRGAAGLEPGVDFCVDFCVDVGVEFDDDGDERCRVVGGYERVRAGARPVRAIAFVTIYLDVRCARCVSYSRGAGYERVQAGRCAARFGAVPRSFSAKVQI